MTTTSDDIFKIGFALSGAISAGAYTAGVVDYFFQALNAWEQARGTDGAPGHRVSVQVITGASAGAITGARRLIFPPLKIGRFGPNLCKTSGFLANFGSKAHVISSLGRNDQSGCCGRHTLFNCGRSLRVPCRHRCQKRTPNPLTRGASPMRASEPQHAKRGVFLFIIKIVILMLVV